MKALSLKPLTVLLFLTLLSYTMSCKKDSATKSSVPPVMFLEGAYAVDSTRIHVAGFVQSTTSPIKEVGVFYTLVKTQERKTIPTTYHPGEDFEVTITGLLPNTTYNVGVYGINEVGEGGAGYKYLILTQ